LGEGAELKFFEKRAGQANEPLLTVTAGWLPAKERNHSDVSSLYVIEVTRQDTVTLELVRQTDRLDVHGLLCTLETWDAPDSEPFVWKFYAREIKQGGVKR
jgi:hypothetical protein